MFAKGFKKLLGHQSKEEQVNNGVSDGVIHMIMQLLFRLHIYIHIYLFYVIHTHSFHFTATASLSCLSRDGVTHEQVITTLTSRGILDETIS